MTDGGRPPSTVDPAHSRALVDRNARERPDLGDAWRDGTPLGNGRVGAVVWGDEPVILTVDHAEFWDRTAEFPVEEHQPFGEFIAALEHRESSWPAGWPVHAPAFGVVTPTRLPPSRFELRGLGDVRTSRHDLAAGRLDIATDAATVTIRSLAEHDVILVEGVGPMPAVVFHWAGDAGAWERPGGQPPMSTHPSELFARHAAPVRSAMPDGERLGHAVPDGSAAGVAWRSTGTADAWSLVIGLAHLRHGDADQAAALAEALITTVGHDTAAAVAAHDAHWHDFHSRSWISVPDRAIEALWYAEMAKLGSAVRGDGPPLGLQGPWSPAGRLPPWGGDLHHNVNVQFSYAPTAITNHAELGDSLARYVTTARPHWLELATSLFGTEGVFVPSATDDEGRCRHEWATVNLAFSSGPWLAHVLHTQWRHTGDAGLLDEVLRPFLHDLAEPLLAQLREHDDGRLHLSHGYSPELIGPSGAWGPDATCDLALFAWLLDALIEVDELAGTDTTRWREIAARLAPLPSDPDIGVIGGVLVGRSGGLRVRADLALERSHRHHSHLLAIHPLRTMTHDHDDPAVRSTVVASMRNLVLAGSGEWVGFSVAWAASIAAHCGAADLASGYLRDYAERWVGPSTFHLQTSRHGEAATIWNELGGFVGDDALSLEAGFAFAAAVAELFLQDHGDVVRVFPALPRSWPTASFAGLRAAGGWEVAARADAGHVVALRVLAHRSGVLRLRYPGADGTVAVDRPMSAGDEFTVVEPGWSIDDIAPSTRTPSEAP